MIPAPASPAAPARPTFRGHLEIARVDHWVKNVFVFPGMLVALSLEPHLFNTSLAWRTLAGLLATGLIASSNYVLNELMDAPFDIHHPTKAARPVPSGRVHKPLAYLQWLVLMAVGLALGLLLSPWLAAVLAVLWVMGCFYNLPPVRTKDLPFLDVLSESVNNPLRMLIGWFIVAPHAVAPLSLLLSYWMVGCYFMAVKRLSEYRMIGDPLRAATYRRSFRYYNEQRLLVAIMFYASTAMLFFGAFIMRYRLELVLSFPLVAFVMAVYLHLAFKEDSAAQAPEKLYREPLLVMSGTLCAAVVVLLLLLDVPVLYRVFAPMAPVAHSATMPAAER